MAGPKACQRRERLAIWSLAAAHPRFSDCCRKQAESAFTIGGTRPVRRLGQRAARPALRGPPFRDFIILTDFSRCQGRVIGRVSRGFLKGPAATAIWLWR